MSSMRRPNLFILGAPRCGTTAMFTFLGEHPEIHPSRIKEPYFFSRERSARQAGEYLALFSGATTERWLLEASPHYIHTPQAPQRIREFSPAARAIVMIRDPVEQIRSLHDQRVLEHLQRSDDLGTELASGEARETYLPSVRSGENLARVLAVFPREDVHVIVFDDFRADNAAAYRRALEFLGVESSFMPQLRTINPTSEPRSLPLQRMLWH